MKGLRRAAVLLMVPFLLIGMPYSVMGKTKKDDKDTKEEAKPTPVEEKSPLSANIAGAQIKIGGFLDGMFVFRDTNTGNNLATGFNLVPFNNTVTGNISESRLSAQNSQFTVSIKDQFDGNNIKGYLETDFLGNNPSSTFVTSNSDVLRLRLYWLDLKKDQLEFTIGQAYSLLTPNRFGLSPENADVFNPKNLDPNKQVGLSWTRAMQFRVAFHPSENISLGLALENPEQYVSSGEVIYPNYYNTVLGGQFDATTSLGTPNLMPDIIAKVAVDSGLIHVEAGAFLSLFQLTYIPIGMPNFTKATATGVGGELNAIIGVSKDFHLVATSFLSRGGGRYLGGLGPDLVVVPDNSANNNLTISPVNAYGGIGGFEAQVSSDTLFAGYFGFDQFDNDAFPDYTSGLAIKPIIGFGGANSPNTANKYIREFSLDLVQNIWKNPDHGALQWGVQYSFVARNPWFVASGAPSEASVNIVYTDLKYLLP